MNESSDFVKAADETPRSTVPPADDSRLASRPGACVEVLDVKVSVEIKHGLDIGKLSLRGAR